MRGGMFVSGSLEPLEISGEASIDFVQEEQFRTDLSSKNIVSLV